MLGSMTDVSCRAFSYFLVAERRGLLQIDALLADLPITRAELEDPRGRVAWDVWAEMCDRAAAQLGHDPERLAQSGTVVADTGSRGFAGYLGPVASLFASPHALFDVVARWGGPALYRSHEFGLQRLPDGRLRFSAWLKPGYRPCLAWFQMIPGALLVLPRLVGQPEALVEVESVTATSGSYLITASMSRTLRARLRQTWAAMRSSQAIGDELAFQQQQLTATIDALRRSEGGFRAALDALPAYVALHRSGVVVYANPALCAAVGRPLRALENAALEELIHGEDRERFARELLVPPTSGEPRQLVVRLTDHGSTIRIVEAAALPPFDFAGRQTEGVFAIDITRRVRMEETFAILEASLPDLVVRLDRDGRVLDVRGGHEMQVQTRALESILGAQTWQLLGAMPSLSREHLERAHVAVERALTTRLEQSLELVTELDGEPRTFELRVVPRQEGDEVVVLVREVTSRRQADRQLAITERMASVGTLAAGVAHEINNPLTYVIAGHDELDVALAAMERGESVDVPALRRLLADVRDGTGRVRDIVASLRAFSRVEPRAPPSPMDPRDAIQRALAMCASELRHRAELEVDLGATPMIVADPSQLIQVVVNLLLNAAQALAGGDAERSATPARSRTIRVVCGTDDAGRARIEVHDTGVGIPPARLKRIFDPFYTTKPVGEGTGLGLSISHRIVHDLGGDITVSSEVGKGSTFVITLPAAPPEAARAAVAAVPAPVAGARVLIVDDELMVATALVRVLTRDGHEATAVGSADAALAILFDREFDLVLCDLMMPGKGGMDLYEEVLARSPVIAARFVFITGGAFTDESRARIERGPRPVLGKPPDLAALRAHVADALRRRVS